WHLCLILSHVNLGHHAIRDALSIGVTPEVSCEPPICQDVDRKIGFLSIASTQCLNNPLIQSLAHEPRVTKVAGDKFFLKVNCAGDSGDHNQSALVALEIHAVKSSAHEKVALG